MQEQTATVVGRDEECRTVEDVLDQATAGTPTLLLVGGDAGIGKSALVDDMAVRARGRGFATLQGCCLDISAHVPFLPIVEALRPVLDDPRATEPTPGLDRLGALIAASGTQESLPPGDLFDLLRRCVAELARGPLLLVLEDMHWSEQSSRDFALALSQSLTGPLVVVLTFRAEDLHRRHPFRSCLVDLGRSPHARNLDLGPLDQRGLAALVARRTGQPPQPAVVSSVLARSEGNPLFAEELIALSNSGTELPSRLSDLLLHRVERLSERTRRTLRLASVTGSRLDVDLLAVVTGASQDDLDTDLREALDFGVVLRRGPHLEFRHGLIREAVYDDLLPGERTRLHGAYAGALQARVDASGSEPTVSQAAQLAYHWYEAHDLPAALASSVVAGRLAERYAASEARVHLDRALDLWDQVPDAERRSGITKPDLLRVAAEVAQKLYDRDHTQQLIREALTLIGPDTDPLVACRVYTSYGRVCADVGDIIGCTEALNRAVAFAEGQESPELAEALAGQGRDLLGYGRFAEGGQVLDRAIAMAERLGDDQGLADALDALTDVHMMFGRFDQAIAANQGLRAAHERAGYVADAAVYHGIQAWLLIQMGRSAEGVEMSREAARHAQAAGLAPAWIFAIEQEAAWDTLSGDLDHADVLLSEMYDSGVLRPRWETLKVFQLHARGDLESALALLRPHLELRRAKQHYAPPEDLVPDVGLLVDAGEVTEALVLAQLQLSRLRGADAPLLEASTLWCGFVASAAAERTGVPVPDGFVPELDARLEVLAARWSQEWDGSWYGGLYAEAGAWASRVHGRVDVSAWQTSLDRWRSSGTHRQAVVVAVELATDLLAADRRDEARELLVETWLETRQRGMRGLAERASTLARRNRIRLPDGDAGPSPLAHLTPREREVLELVATGASNRAIGAALFISGKTVSVHVSNVLAKLGVSSRGEAAAFARETASS